MNINQLMDFTGKSFRTIKRLLGPLKPVRSDGRADHYDTKEALKLLYPTHTSELAQESLMLERAKRQKLEIEVATLQGKLIPIEDVAKEVGREYEIVRAQFRSLPTKNAKLLAITTDPIEVQKILSETINESLNELSADAKFEEQQLIANQATPNVVTESSVGPEADTETERS